MFKTTSMTGSGLLVLAFGLILNWLGLTADDSQIQVWVESAINIAGFIMLVVGTLRRKDLSWGFWRKN